MLDSKICPFSCSFGNSWTNYTCVGIIILDLVRIDPTLPHPVQKTSISSPFVSEYRTSPSLNATDICLSHFFCRVIHIVGIPSHHPLLT